MCSELITDWHYRAEGNASIVIANVKEHIVYRMLKTSPSAASPEDIDKLKKSVENVVSFHDQVMSLRIGSEFLTSMNMITVSEDFIKAVEDMTHQLRPVHRLHKGLNPAMSFAIQLDDLCRLHVDFESSEESVYPTISVEIKPKWGFMPAPTTHAAPVTCSNCRFCMHQLTKVLSGKWKRRSHYCPIDLFSGCPERVKSALHRLLVTPQNNLCLFLNGIVAWNESLAAGETSSNLTETAPDVTSFHRSRQRARDTVLEELLPHIPDLPSGVVESFCAPACRASAKEKTDESLCNLIDIVTRCLLHEEVKGEGSCDHSDASACGHAIQRCSVQHNMPSLHCCNADCPTLPKQCVLSRILGVQKLDDLGIETLIHHYNILVKHFKTLPGDRERLKLDGPYSPDWLDNETTTTTSTSSDDHYLSVRKVKEFLLSRSAKDCSIFVSVRRVNGLRTDSAVSKSTTRKNQFQMNDLYGRRFVCRVCVIDLDPKSFDKIPFYLDEERDIVRNYEMTVINDKERQPQ